MWIRKPKHCYTLVAVIRDDFREHPSSSVDVAVGQEAVLRCRPPRGDPEPRIRWTKDGTDLSTASNPSRPVGQSLASAVGGSPSTGSQSASAGARVYVDPTSGSLHIEDARRDDAGTYVCVASNAAGERESSPARLNVRGGDKSF